MVDREHRFDISAVLRSAIAASGLTIREYALKYELSHTVVSCLKTGRRGPDCVKASTLEKVLKSFGATLNDYEPRLQLVPAAAKRVRQAIDDGVPYTQISKLLDFAAGQSMVRSLNCVEGGNMYESGLNGLMLMLGALEPAFKEKVEAYLKMPAVLRAVETNRENKAKAPVKETALSDADKLKLKLVKIGSNYGFDKGELEAAFVPEDGRLVWYSDSKLYRFELNVDGFTAYWTPTGRVSVERKFGRLYKDADKRGTAEAAGRV